MNVKTEAIRGYVYYQKLHYCDINLIGVKGSTLMSVEGRRKVE